MIRFLEKLAAAITAWVTMSKAHDELRKRQPPSDSTEVARRTPRRDWSGVIVVGLACLTAWGMWNAAVTSDLVKRMTPVEIQIVSSIEWSAPSQPTVSVTPLDTAANLQTSAFAPGDSAGVEDDYGHSNWRIWAVADYPGGSTTWTALNSDSTESYAGAGASIPLTMGADYVVTVEHCGVNGGCSLESEPDTFTTTLGVPSTPTQSVSPTDTSAVVSLSPFDGGTHDSTQIQLDTVTASPAFSTPTADSVSGAVEKDTIFGLPTGAELIARGRYKDNGAGWSNWSETDTFTVSEPTLDTAGVYTLEPQHWTLADNLISFEAGDKKDFDGWRNGSPSWSSGTSSGGPPTIEDDPTCPVFNKVVEFRTEVGEKGTGSNKFWWSEGAFGNTSTRVDTLYIGWYVKLDAVRRNADFGDQSKEMYINHAVASGGEKNYFTAAMRGSNSSTSWKLTQQVGNGKSVNIWFNDPSPVSESTWHKHEKLMIAQSLQTEKDGHLTYTIDGDTVFTADTMTYTDGDEEGTGFTGMEIYDTRNNAITSDERTWWMCGMKISGNN